jgi:hypothetical protein
MTRTIAIAAAIIVAGLAVSLSVLYASSVEHRDAQTQEQILKDIRGIDCQGSSTCTSFNY